MRRRQLIAVLALACAPLASTTQAAAAELPIEPFRYDYAKRCLKRPQAGTLALQSWLERHSRGVFWGIVRCEKLSGSSYSLHSEGRAIDWHLDAHDGSDRRDARRLIELLLAPDADGNSHALARRMGVQEIIWSCRAWWAGESGMRRYSLCFDSKGRAKRVDDTSAHRNHLHIGLSWAGARKRTSFWRHGAG
ncbi:MAG TPA: hypothetical protein VF545_02350 [Thermoleophilaceae bacterium]